MKARRRELLETLAVACSSTFIRAQPIGTQAEMQVEFQVSICGSTMVMET